MEQQEEEENMCDGSALSVSTQGGYLWGISGNPPHRVGGFLSGGLSLAFGVDHSTEQPKP